MGDLAVMNGEKVYGSVEELLSDGATQVEFLTIDGFTPGSKIRIGSVTAGDMIEWSEANEAAKQTAAIRLICRSLVGPEPENIRYADNDKYIQHFKKLRHKDSERILKEIIKLNGMSVKQDTAAKND